MFRPWPAMSLAALGLVGLSGFGVSLLPFIDGVKLLTVSVRTLGLYASVACYGVFSGSFYFKLVFYSLVHPHRSAKYVAVNETIIGICGVAGPALAGMLADRFGFAFFPVVLIMMIVGVSMVQFVVLKQLEGQVARVR